MNQAHAMMQFETLLTQMLDDYPFIHENIAFTIRKRAPDVVGVLMNLHVADKQFAPFPPVEEIVAAQCTVFDNWPGGTKPKTVKGKRQKGARAERFKTTIEVWTTVEGAGKMVFTKGNAAFVGTAHLLNGDRLADKVKKLVAKDDSEEMARFAYDMMLPMTHDGGLRCGPMMTTGNGTFVHMGTHVVADAKKLDRKDGDLTVTVKSPNGNFTFSDWSTSYSSGAPLKGNAVLTSRWSNIDKKQWWTTEPKR